VPVSLSEAKAPEISAQVAARLAQLPAIIGEGNWDDAIDVLTELAAQPEDTVVAVDASRYVSLRTYCQMQLARLPGPALARYRQRFDPLAERFYHQGLAARDAALLRRVTDEYFCSSLGDEALLALGELALEQADYAAARRYWRQISALVKASPLGAADGQPEYGDSTGILTYPDTSLHLADVEARLVLASIRAGEWPRAAAELRRFRAAHGEAAGRLGGQDGALATLLERLLGSADKWPTPPFGPAWPTFAGSPSRSGAAAELGPNLVPAWPEAVALTSVVSPEAKGWMIVNGQPQEVTIRAQRRPLSCHPVIAAGRVFFADGSHVRAVGLASGRPAVTASGVVYHEANDHEAGGRFQVIDARQRGTPNFTLTVSNDHLYARLGTRPTARGQLEAMAAQDRLVGLDLSREGLLTFRARPEDERWSFDGAPLCDGNRVFAAMRRGDAHATAAVACFDASSGRLNWRTTIGSADTPAAGRGDEFTHNLLTLVGDRVYFNTNVGLVAALDAVDGHIAWLHRYPRRTEPIEIGPDGGPVHLARDPSPAVYHAGLLLFAPSDTPRVFALDAETGRMVWSTDELSDALYLLGVAEETLIAGGKRIWGLNVQTGQRRFAWPERDNTRIRGAGRGLVAGPEVFWPARGEVHVLNAMTGRPTRPPIDLSPVGIEGANLVAGEGYLVAAGYEKMMAFAPPPKEPLGAAPDVPATQARPEPPENPVRSRSR
jgi:outer membrane protein assembly factor BamB